MLRSRSGARAPARLGPETETDRSACRETQRHGAAILPVDGLAARVRRRILRALVAWLAPTRGCAYCGHEPAWQVDRGKRTCIECMARLLNGERVPWVSGTWGGEA